MPKTFLLNLIMAATPLMAQTTEDPYIWLEDIDGERAMAWVREQNARTAKELESEEIYPQLYRDALAALNSESRIPSVSIRGDYVYNLWKDEAHPRGIYRRATLASFRSGDPEWQTIFDIDAMSKADGEQWVFRGLNCLEPEYRKCLLSLSPGGTDAVMVREYDLEELEFVEDGFNLPVAKHRISWRDEDAVYIGTDFGTGTMTTSGYPRIAKLWKRGTPLAQAEMIREGDIDSVAVAAYRLHGDEVAVDLVNESPTFWTNDYIYLGGDEPRPLALPDSAEIEGAYKGELVISLKEDWNRGGSRLEQGWVLIGSPEVFMGDGEIEVLVRPDASEVVESVRTTKEGILVTMLDNVRGRLYRYERGEDGWTRREISFPDNGAINVGSVDDATGNFFVQYESFTTPPTLYFVSGPSWKPVKVVAQEPTFGGSRYEVSQNWATSKDGTKVPYFVVMRKGTKLDGTNPTHIFSYGGFRNALTPSYSGSYEAHFGAYGKGWLDRGGVFVLANIRGGGEFGPAWHAAALRENRPRSFEDFEAIAEDLIERKITSPEHLGIEGRSNGGLLVTATMTRRPDLYGATIVGSPLVDMKRYHELLAGASWMAEYGDPDVPADWEYMRMWSPYQNFRDGVDYPPTFVYASTRDDRVHPGHARKTVAKLLELGEEVYYWENIEGGHGASSTNEQTAHRIALSYTHLWRELGGSGEEPAARRIDRKE
ncbi:MAG: prolyl oligopeptidase family serine peptidase [Acidobacteria bacterium]|nr:prolyl oligopeptidase family serine peptidase [Acidobacteriota bacterium]